MQTNTNGISESLALRIALATMPDETLLTAREVALIISPKRSIQRVYQSVHAGELRAVKRNKKNLRFRAGDVRTFLEPAQAARA